MTQPGAMAQAALGLGLAHRKLKYYASLGTPLGSRHRRARAGDARADVPRRPEVLRAHSREKHPARQAELEAQRAVLARQLPPPGVAKSSSWSWIWPRAWRWSPAASCCGSRRSRGQISRGATAARRGIAALRRSTASSGPTGRPQQRHHGKMLDVPAVADGGLQGRGAALPAGCSATRPAKDLRRRVGLPSRRVRFAPHSPA